MAVVGLSASACTSAPARGAWYADATDLARAQAVWADPWVAPTATKVAQYQSTNSGVLDRVVGVRTTEGDGGEVRARAIQEVAAAATVGWELVSVSCTTSAGAAEPTRVEVALQRSATDLDRAATATVTTTSAWSGASATYTTVSVTVPHHLDTWWPRSVPTSTAQTCLGSGPSVTALPTLQPGPWTDHGPADPASLPNLAVPTWSGPVVPDDLAAAIRAAGDDPWLTRLRLSPALPAQSVQADEVRSAASASAPNGSRLAPLAELVAQAPAPWRLTYAACFGPAGPASAELVRDLSGGRWVTVRLSTPGGQGSPVTGASSVIATPGVSRTASPAIVDPCFSAASRADGFAASGIPGFGPTSTQPMLAKP